MVFAFFGFFHGKLGFHRTDIHGKQGYFTRSGRFNNNHHSSLNCCRFRLNALSFVRFFIRWINYLLFPTAFHFPLVYSLFHSFVCTTTTCPRGKIDKWIGLEKDMVKNLPFLFFGKTTCQPISSFMVSTKYWVFLFSRNYTIHLFTFIYKIMNENSSFKR